MSSVFTYCRQLAYLCQLPCACCFCVKESYDKLTIFGLAVYGGIISPYPLNSVGDILADTSNVICDSVLDVSKFRPTDDSYVIPSLVSLLSFSEFFVEITGYAFS